MRRTVVDPRFQARLTTLMIEQAISGKQLAERARVSRSYLSEIINGLKMPSEQVAKALDETLDAGGRLADLVACVALVDDLDPLAAAAANPARISPDAVRSLARVLSAQRHLEDSVGAAAVIGPVMAQVETVERMVSEATGPHRPALMQVAGQYGQFVGWLHTSLGQWPDAGLWNTRALEWATEAGDPDLIATILSYQGHVAWLRMQWGPTIGLAGAALRDRTVYVGQRAYDAFQSARAHAAIGDVTEAERMLTAGDELAEQVPLWVGEIPPWQYYRAPWLWELERGLVWRYIARWRPVQATIAVDHLRSGLAGMPEHMQSSDWAAEYMVHLAAAYLHADATQTAREVLADAKRIAEATSSRRVLRLVAGRERQLANVA